jgi:hypothetical protein
MTQPTPDRIMQVGTAFWASKTLLSAVEIGLFTELACSPGDLDSLRARLNLHPRAARDFLDALVALGFLERENGVYRNTLETGVFLDRAQPSYIGGILEMANARLYPFWGRLTEALRSGAPQNEARLGGDPFAAIYADPQRLRDFLQAMTCVSRGANLVMAQQLPWAGYRSFVDVGTAQGDLAVRIALAQPQLEGIGFDLPPVGPIFEDYVAAHALSERLRFVAGDFFVDPLPRADVVLMGHVLHDWGLERKRLLIGKAYAALPDGGALVVYDALIDDARRRNAFGLLMSLNMLIETPEGFDYSGADCERWMREAGFRQTRVEHLVGPDSMVLAFK